MRTASALASFVLAVALAPAACSLDPFPVPLPAMMQAAGCAGSASCDDDNPCTVDTCTAGVCHHAPAAAGLLCGSTGPCNAASTCDGAGTCRAGAPLPIDDGDACTTDACDPMSGVVSHTPLAQCWSATPTTAAPTPRKAHTAVWTGSAMIVWGGNVGGSPSVTSTGGVYDPVALTWTPTSTTGAPSPRSQHIAVWTGYKMLVWGGYGVSAYETSGGVYDPSNDTWKPMATAGAPSGRTEAAFVWTGSKLFLWGGTASGSPLADGAAYDPASDAWTALPTSGALSPRYGASAVLASTSTSSDVIVWGGYDTVNWLNDGVTYDPVANAWGSATSANSPPEGRLDHAAVWTGSQMVVWGGANPTSFVSTGGVLDPATGTWTALSASNAPAPRAGFGAVWTGNVMMVWGGCGGQVCDPLGDGGLWTPGPGGGTWAPIPASTVVAGRSADSMVWTGSASLVWGGETSAGRTATGASFSP